MVDWLIVSVIYFLPMLAVVLWLAVAVPYLMASSKVPSIPEESTEARRNDVELSSEMGGRLDYIKDKERRDQAVLDTFEDTMEFLKSTLKQRSHEELLGTERLLHSVKLADEAAPRQKQKEAQIGS